jgi:hypothetical protein
MGYAVRNDGLGWRGVDSADDCATDETFSETMPPPIVENAWVEYKQQAQAALDKSDMTVIRCVEAGVTLPAAWVTYRKALRAIVGASTGDPTQALPMRPAYPAGT